MKITQGWLEGAQILNSPHCDPRPANTDIRLLVIHNISLPPAQFESPATGHSYISDLFMGKLDPTVHPYFAEIHQLRVSAHCLIKRDGQVCQFVPFEQRAWHAGVSVFQGVPACNDYSIGIELEGTDNIAYTDAQYSTLVRLTQSIMQTYPSISLGRIVGHNDIAPGRKTDPGVAFDWAKLRTKVSL
ncbi:1,6-anhydro-N-acetylmuramyl-L-alanine amidase AmpD [Alteromonadaceae bacterium BrNp21-10]|nr:1,6-anhydro-N-acetylmuramyl-L-alanine amidase AmpD [Alteromonadaceae bacterium BrNp21-10]